MSDLLTHCINNYMDARLCASTAKVSPYFMKALSVLSAVFAKDVTIVIDDGSKSHLAEKNI